MYARTYIAAGEDDGTGLGKFFSDPALLRKLAANPRTAKHLADASFMQQIQVLQRNPRLAGNVLSDPRMIDVLGVAMGVDMQGFARPEGSDEVPDVLKDLGGERGSASPQSASQSSASTSTSAPKPAPTPAQAPPAKVEEDVEMAEAEEDEEEAKLKKEAEAEKKTGADAYKVREFETAAKHFEKAWEIWPKDITFLTNLAGEPTGPIGLELSDRIHQFFLCLFFVSSMLL